MNKTNYFIEGLQGAGKSIFVQKLSEVLDDYKVFREGDYSPIELAWCAYVTEEQYTQILTDRPGFHRELERYEIYNSLFGIVYPAGNDL